MRHYNKLNISTILKEISNTLKKEKNIRAILEKINHNLKQETFWSKIIASGIFISILALILNYFDVFPKAKLKIEDATLNFDIKAMDDSTFLDSLYVKVNIINDGNKATSVNKIKIDIIDEEYYFETDWINDSIYIDFEKLKNRNSFNYSGLIDSLFIDSEILSNELESTLNNKIKIDKNDAYDFNKKAINDSVSMDSQYVYIMDKDDFYQKYIFTGHKFLRSPGILEPGENSEVILMVEPIICLKIPGTKNIFKIKGIYKVPHKSYKKWQKISKIFDEYFNYVIVTFPIKGRIFLHIEINYGNNKEYEWYRELKYIEPIDLTLPPLSRPRIINYE